MESGDRVNFEIERFESFCDQPQLRLVKSCSTAALGFADID
jgi:hypothetical protein